MHSPGVKSQISSRLWPWIFAWLTSLILVGSISVQAADETPLDPKSLPVRDLDSLLKVKDQLWSTDIEVVEKHFKKHGFVWLTESKAGLRSVYPKLTLFADPVGETIVRAASGKVNRITVSIYNRGDNGPISQEEFVDLYSRWWAHADKYAGTKAEENSGSQGSAVGLNRTLWYSGGTSVLLESSTSGLQPEFIRFRLGPKPKGAMYLSSTTGLTQNTRDRSDLRQSIQRDPNGDVFLSGIPMVDQGAKGYCAVAAAERVFRYYGVEVDQHEMAQLAETSAMGGTSRSAMLESLKQATHKTQMRVYSLIDEDWDTQLDWIKAYNREASKEGSVEMPEDPYYFGLATILPDSGLNANVLLKVRTTRGNYFESFQRMVSDTIGEGVPLLWAVSLGLFPEPEIPQAFGGHMRLIIGYNPQTKEILYSDTWGAGHEKKRMAMDKAYTITDFLGTMKPAR